MPYATNGDVSLFYERSGPADAPTVVFVEGLGYGRWMWRWQRDALIDDYDTVVWDNRGTGDSDEPGGPYEMTEMAADLEAVLDAVNAPRAHVVGASLGGMIALQHALEYDRAASLSLFCTTPGGPESVPTPEETLQRMFDVPEEYDERAAIRHKMAPATSDDLEAERPGLIERIVDWRIESDASEHARQWQAAAGESFDVSDRLSSITEPALVVHGTADRVVPVENGDLLADGLPNARYHRLDGAPHLFFVERADETNDVLRGFLDDVAT